MNIKPTIRFAERKDAALILHFIKELAQYERLLNEVSATEELILKNIFDQKHAEVIICEIDNQAVGFALFFHNFSTFVGKPGLYLEDLYVKPEFRKKGLGVLLLSYLAKIAIDRDCGRFEWTCLDWNQSSIDFYLRMGAIPMSEWTVYRVAGENLQKLAEKHA